MFHFLFTIKLSIKQGRNPIGSLGTQIFDHVFRMNELKYTLRQDKFLMGFVESLVAGQLFWYKDVE